MMNTAKLEGLMVRVGGQSRTEVVQALRDVSVQLNARAETLLTHPAFDAPRDQTLRIVERTAEQLGLEKGAVQSQVFATARTQGLELCPLVTGPYLRLALMDQANAPDSVLSAGRGPTGAIHIASEPVSEDVDYPKGFYIRVVDGQAWLRGYRCDDTYVWAPKQRLAFLLPES
ncbi:hypothetical protein [Arthrobacter sp. H5]|uniref:hypothetical protein n=1 Tax=Arthrobacter sp. H5 TaxID=1267973 RepID=UPI0004826539|nr:hypothetical protein [Arthrobacter sp. H5]